MICLIYMDGSAPAHMRYSVRRLRRKAPKAIIILCCLSKDADATELERLREISKADLIANSLGGAMRLSLEAIDQHLDEPDKENGELSATTAA